MMIKSILGYIRYIKFRVESIPLNLENETVVNDIYDNISGTTDDVIKDLHRFADTAHSVVFRLKSVIDDLNEQEGKEYLVQQLQDILDSAESLSYNADCTTCKGWGGCSKNCIHDEDDEDEED